MTVSAPPSPAIPWGCPWQVLGEVHRPPARSGQLLLRRTGKGGRCRGTDGDRTAPLRCAPLRSPRCPGHGLAGAAASPAGARWLPASGGSGEGGREGGMPASPRSSPHIPAPRSGRGKCRAPAAGKGDTRRCPSPQLAPWGCHFTHCHLSPSKGLLDVASYEMVFVCVVGLGGKAYFVLEILCSLKL